MAKKTTFQNRKRYDAEFISRAQQEIYSSKSPASEIKNPAEHFRRDFKK